MALTQTSFSIYNASAGSGKTFTLVKEYLKQLLQSKNVGQYRHLLAITFTNKAVAEMKQRIVDTLVEFSEEDSSENPSPMMHAISEETELSLEEIRERSKKILRHLLHNYAAFSVETIDKFNHRLIRTFARDLQLAQNFEVSLDQEEILEEAVDSLLSKTGINKAITDIVLDFALQKTDDDKSWDIARDITTASKLLFIENEAVHTDKLKEKTLDDFSEFKKQLFKKKEVTTKELKSEAQSLLDLFGKNNITKNEFSGGWLWNHFENLANGKAPSSFDSAWQKNLEDKIPYPTRVPASLASVIEGLKPDIISCYHKTKQLFFELDLIDRILNNITPLSVINLVAQEIEAIKEERNLLLISEFNFLINQEIKNQPAPFIYERLGEKYRHFFIDEFQDTSKLQWENLIPLIDNALSQSTDSTQGSLLLVGDAKQSIYRWRGGLPEQFMDLYGDGNPFSVSNKRTENLDTNYRSHKEIIDFNNRFFTFISKHFANSTHEKLYKDSNNQKFNRKEGGYVKIEFVEDVKKEELEPLYGELTYQTIENALSLGYSLKDICILTRKRDEGVALASYLMEKEIPVISSESLLLQSSDKVQLLMLTFSLALHPDNQEVKVKMLDKLHDYLELSEDKHSFFSKLLPTNEYAFSKVLKEFDIDLNLDEIRSRPLYDAFEYIIQQFQISKNADAYLFAFMDFVYEFGLRPLADKAAFLDHWENKREKAAIPSSEEADAVQLMTIHKSKGLEFPIVIFPYADIQLRDTKRSKLWYPVSGEGHNFDYSQVNATKNLEQYGEAGTMLYQDLLSQLEMDNINLLYVTFTRAVEKLFVFTKTPKASKESPNTYNDLFRSYLEHLGVWDDNQVVYEFGENSEKQGKRKEKTGQITPQFISSDPRKHNLFLVPAESHLLDEEIETARMIGNIFHNAMARIQKSSDAEEVLSQLQQRAILPSEEFETLKSNIDWLLNHPELSSFFDGSDTIYPERDIITASGTLIRPDRINIHANGTASILDYKTGSYLSSHQEQLKQYMNAVEEMGYPVANAYLVYIEKEGLMLRKNE